MASLMIAGFGVCAGSVYVLGFSILQSEVGDELRGRVFATLYASTRLCLFLALVVAPLATGVLDGLSRVAIHRQVKFAGVTVHLPGVRLTLWLGGFVILGAGGSPSGRWSLAWAGWSGGGGFGSGRAPGFGVPA